MRATVVAAGLVAALGQWAGGQTFRPEIPKVWDEREVERFELPLVQPDRSPRYMTAEQYYALKVRPIYRSYPVYAPGRTPPGYLEALKQKEPEIIFDASKLRTREDWIQAGKLVFEAETRYFPASATPPFDHPSIKPSADGILPSFLPGNTYIIRKKGVLEMGINACAGCHTRIMPDGSMVAGAQGIVDPPPTAESMTEVRDMTQARLERRRKLHWEMYGAPWIMDKETFQKSITMESVFRSNAADHPGVLARQGTSDTHRPHVPSLIGILDIKYLDATGFVRHRSPGDLARYAVVNQGLDTLAHFGDFQPSAGPTPFSGDEGTRYSDEQLYALALYLYSLKPPQNPNPMDDRALRGQKIFQQQGCGGCHTPPLYTNNKLTPALGFRVPEHLKKSDDILAVSVGTDPTLAMKTRRGTGFYKVPSLRGVWYRNAFGHGGQAETLEEWFDPARLKDGYIPKGFHLGPGPIQGHEFGLQLPVEDKQSLIAFLKTL